MIGFNVVRCGRIINENNIVKVSVKIKSENLFSRSIISQLKISFRKKQILPIAEQNLLMINTFALITITVYRSMQNQ